MSDASALPALPAPSALPATAGRRVAMGGRGLRSARRVAAAGLAALLVACGAGSEGDDRAVRSPAAEAASGIDARDAAGELGAAPPRGDTLRARSTEPVAARIVLAAPASREAAAAQTAGPMDLAVPRQVGVARAVAEAATAASTRERMDWQSLPDGRRVAALSVTSATAQGLRLGLVVRRLPVAATVRFYAQGSALAHEVPAAEVLDVLQANRAAGLAADAADTYWSPLIEGAEATVEIELPAHATPDAVGIAVPWLSHLDALPPGDTSPKDLERPHIGEAGFCQIDVSCRPEDDAQSRSVARLLFIRDGNSYLCSGTLLRDRGGSGTPYLLTARHCVPDQAAASSLQTFWFYRSSACNARTLSPDSRTVTGGAALLYASAATDTAFVRLNGMPPAGAVAAAWSAAPLEFLQPVFGLHHPRGDLQKISMGAVSSFVRCVPSPQDPAFFECGVANREAASFVDVRNSQGATEAGSSGSPLFVRSGGISYVTGQLYGGTASCRTPWGSNIYGRFDLAYAAALHQWLDGPARSAVYRFYNRRTGAHFYTANATERDQVIATNPSYLYEGITFYAYARPTEGTRPVHRFYNRTTGAHFFTINEAEKAFVRATFADFIDEGVGWYASAPPRGDAIALFRFYRRTGGTHFYTPSAAERAQVLATLPDFMDEGIAYHVWARP